MHETLSSPPASLNPPAQSRAVEPKIVQAESPDRKSDRNLRLLALPGSTESRAKRLIFLAVALAIVVGYGYFIRAFWAPANGGIDQNAYLVGGKMIAEHFSPGLKPSEPYQYIGWMWIRTPDGWYYPKYPIGLPLLNAIPLWIDWTRGKVWTMSVAPACAVLGIAGIFFLTRRLAGSFLAVLAILLLGMSQTALAVANSPWSHAPALCFSVWGMYFLICWWESGSLWCGMLAGFLLGYALTIRYTEGLLLLPLMLVFLLSIKWKHPQTYWRASIPLLAWLIPVGLLVLFNKMAMGTWTGYDTTNESTGFSWTNFQDKWEFMVQQIYDYGMLFVAPLAVVGLVAIYRASWKLALLLTLWFVPGVVIYTAYYWGLQRAGVGYLRFFLTLFPPMILAACWYMRQVGWSARGAIAAPIACGILVAISAAFGLRNSLPALAREQAANLNLAWTCDQLALHAPAGSVVFADAGGGGPMQSLLNFLPFKGDYELYAISAFSPRGMGFGGPERDADQPNPMQKARQDYLREEVYSGKTQEALVGEQHRIVDRALAENRRAFFIAPVNLISMFRGRFISDSNYQLLPIMKWKEPAAIPAEKAASPLMPAQRGPGARRQQSWQLFEIKRLPPASQPVNHRQIIAGAAN